MNNTVAAGTLKIKNDKIPPLADWVTKLPTAIISYVDVGPGRL